MSSLPLLPRRTVIREFLAALSDKHTYRPAENVEALFGFLWGLPIPIFAFGIHLYATGTPPAFQNCLEILKQNPLYIIFLLHPLLFAVVFGALGTMRSKRDLQIEHLIDDLEKHCNELCIANDRLQQVDRLKTEFLANVTHELKSPLVTALGYSDRILNEKLGPVTDKQRNALSISKRNLIRLRGLIEEILDFSRLEAGVGKFSMEALNLNAIVEAAQSDLVLKARERNIRIETSLPEEPTQVKGDKTKLTQSVVNLLDNAIKFSPDNRDIKISVAPEDAWWHVEIKDEGPGISAEDQARLFQRFSQADGSLSKPYAGVGLGLVIVKKIIEAHSGEVWLTSNLGSGTTAHIRLPKSTATTVATESVNEAPKATSVVPLQYFP